MDGEVLRWHWDDRARYEADYRYVVGFYERALAAVGDSLNAIHGVNYPVRYWRILIGPWLGHFVQILLDRWRSIEAALQWGDVSGTVIVDGLEEEAIPNDMNGFAQLMFTDEWNHFIYGEVVVHLANIPVLRRNAGRRTPAMSGKHGPGFRQRIVSAYGRVAQQFVRDGDMFSIATLLPVVEDFKLQLRLGQVPQFWDVPIPESAPVDPLQRKWVIKGTAESAFESFALSLVPAQIPVTFLEGFRSLRRQVDRLPWPKRPKVIFSSGAFWDDTVGAAYAADKVSQGAPLVYAQHGGGYGVSKFSWAEEHEVAIADRYLTWGWGDPSEPKVRPVGVQKRVPNRSTPSSEAATLLLVLIDAPRYTHWLGSGCWFLKNKYPEECLAFAEALPENLRQRLLMRHHSFDLGWNHGERWQDRLPDVARDPGRRAMQDVLDATRIGVYSYNSTGYLEMFAQEIPTVLFWDPALNPPRESATPYFEALKRAGVLHDTGAGAARQVAAVWQDVDSWWNSEKVRGAIEPFKARFCYAPDDILDRLEANLRGAVEDSSQAKPRPDLNGENRTRATSLRTTVK